MIIIFEVKCSLSGAPRIYHHDFKDIKEFKTFISEQRQNLQIINKYKIIDSEDELSSILRKDHRISNWATSKRKSNFL